MQMAHKLYPSISKLHIFGCNCHRILNYTVEPSNHLEKHFKYKLDGHQKSTHPQYLQIDCDLRFTYSKDTGLFSIDMLPSIGNGTYHAKKTPLHIQDLFLVTNLNFVPILNAIATTTKHLNINTLLKGLETLVHCSGPCELRSHPLLGMEEWQGSLAISSFCFKLCDLPSQIIVYSLYFLLIAYDTPELYLYITLQYRTYYMLQHL